MSSDIVLGKLITTQQHRDAIHIAVFPAINGDTKILRPAQHVGLVIGSGDNVVACKFGEGVGIVDPFLQYGVSPRQKCFVMLYQNTVTSLRHEWTHPAFKADDSAEKVLASLQKLGNTESHAFMKQYADRVEMTPDELIEACKEANVDDDFCARLSFDTPDEVYTQKKELWRHFKILTGIEPADENRTFFSCSC